MADPVGFEGANFVFKAPENMPDCGDLEVFRDGEVIVSCWRLTDEEFQEILETGVVWLSVWGQGTPPVAVSGKALVEIDGRPARAEPVLKRKDG